MEIKKSPKADLENKKTTNLLIGAILTLSVLFIGFEWSELVLSQNRNNLSKLRRHQKLQR